MTSEFRFGEFKFEVWLTGCGDDSEAHILIIRVGVCPTEFYRFCAVSLRPGVRVPGSFRSAVGKAMEGVEGWRGGRCLDDKLMLALRQLTCCGGERWLELDASAS